MTFTESSSSEAQNESFPTVIRSCSE